ncbi:hypothetical protein [Photobacterium sanguinicancri]|uniref:hypothetical protein n=1 Tax=Photobacterium sanguinicancri TaxID=875932 RepID=UPI003D0B51D2
MITDKCQPTDVSINNLLRMVQSQLSNVSSLVDTHTELVNGSLAQEADEYNALIHQLEEADTKNQTLELKVIELIKTAEEEDLNHIEQLTKLRSEFNSLRLRTKDFSDMRAELKRLKSLDPDALKRKLSERNKVADERLNTINAMKRENSAYRKENVKLKRDHAELMDTALKATELADSLQERITHIDGDVKNKVYTGKDGLECFIYTFGWRLTYIPVARNISVISDLDFHIVIRTNWAINITVSVSDYLVPFMPSCTDLEGKMPTDLYGDLQELFIERLSVSHSHLIDRMEWAKETGLEECDKAITPRELKLLNDANYFSIYSVMHSTEHELAKSVKGISEKSAKKIRRSVDQIYVKEWETANWTREQRGLK